MTALAAARSLPMWRAAAVRDFRLLWGSEAISVVGDQFSFVALSWLVIDLTRSGLALGTVLIAAGVPRALMLLPFGVLADRRPPRNLMLVAHVARGLIVGALAALVLSGTASLPLLALLGALFGIADALYMPAQQAFLPRTLDANRLPSANALLQSTMQLAAIAGPPIAGAMIAVIGTGTAFVLDSASFFVAAIVVGMISSRGLPRPAAPTADQPSPDAGSVETDGAPADAMDEAVGERESFVAAIRSAVRYVLADSALRDTLLLSLVLNFALNGPAAVGMPWLAAVRFDSGPVGLGLMSAGWAAGALVGTLVAGNTRAGRHGAILTCAIAIAGLAMMVVGVGAWLPVVMIALAVMGAMIGYVNILAISWLQARVETEMIGRVMSLAMLMGFGITPLSLGVAGALLDVDATLTFVAAGALVALVALVAAALRFPARFDAPPSRGRASEAIPQAEGVGSQ